MLKYRRQQLRKLRNRREADSGNDRLKVSGLGAPELFSLHRVLWTQRADLHREGAEAQARLEVLKKAVGDAAAPARSEIGQIERRLADLEAQEKAIDEELQQMLGAIQEATSREEARADTALMEDGYRKIAAEVEALTIEQGAPPRVRKFDPAVVPL
jgi:hypothetical protein